MAWKNGPEHWGIVSRALHWGIALLILIEVPAGLIMSRTFGTKDPVLAIWQYWSSNVHHTAGLLILLFALLRTIWRLVGPIPDALPALTALDRRIARGTHWMLYALLLMIPLSGWAALSALADSSEYGPTVLWFFGSNGFTNIVPRIVPAVPWDSDEMFRYTTFAKAHRWLLIAGAVLLVLHISAALRHHFIAGDATLRRMLHGQAGVPPVG